MPVYLTFNSIGEWHLYGVRAATDYAVFDIKTHTPASFPYSGTSATGYGGLLLVGQYTYSGDPLIDPPVCYDRSCPVESMPDICVEVDRNTLRARCPKCGSTYDVFGGYGLPLSGPALDDHYTLTRYRVTAGSFPYLLVTR